jgi:catechol 2,3-dioxygenase-like lactoylglutathione lyase family enzyme
VKGEPTAEVRELRLALTVENYAEALAFYRDALGLPQLAAWEAPGANVAILDAGRATLELLDAGQAAEVDRLEVGRRVAGTVRIALEVDDSAGVASRLVAAGAEQLAEPVETPWRHRNVRLAAPDGMQLTLFTVLE